MYLQIKLNQINTGWFIESDTSAFQEKTCQIKVLSYEKFTSIST